MVGTNFIVIFSHSSDLAEGKVTLALEIGGKELPMNFLEKVINKIFY